MLKFFTAGIRVFSKNLSSFSLTFVAFAPFSAVGFSANPFITSIYTAIHRLMCGRKGGFTFIPREISIRPKVAT